MTYHDKRAFDPTSGQFMSSEPMGCEEDKLNAYRHVDANPQNHVDPTSL